MYGWRCFVRRIAANGGLHEAGPPVFFTKKFEMAEDPATDSLVSSWNRARNSDIIWHIFKYSSTLLRRYFEQV